MNIEIKLDDGRYALVSSYDIQSAIVTIDVEHKKATGLQLVIRGRAEPLPVADAWITPERMQMLKDIIGKSPAEEIIDAIYDAETNLEDSVERVENAIDALRW